MRLALRLLAAAPCLCACAAARNPGPPPAPSSWKAGPAARPSTSAAAPASTSAATPASTPVSSSAASPAPAPGAAPAGPAASPARLGRPAEAGVPIAFVAGKPIDVSELLAQWLHQDSLQVLEQIDHLVLGRLVLAEAARLSVKIDPAAAEKAYADAVAAIEKVIGQKRPGVSLDRYVDEALGLDPLVYRERLRDEALRGLLAERVVRAFVLQSERSEARVIVVKSEADVKAVKDALAGGEAFAEIARRLSADVSAKDGGRVPAILRADTLMARLAAQTSVGEVGGPMFDKGAWLFLLVEARPAPLAGDWAAIAEAVERSLVERRLEDLEIRQWKDAMVGRYPVDVSPILKLAGQPGR